MYVTRLSNKSILRVYIKILIIRYIIRNYGLIVYVVHVILKKNIYTRYILKSFQKHMFYMHTYTPGWGAREQLKLKDARIAELESKAAIPDQVADSPDSARLVIYDNMTR
jgi:hypothetical protein